MNKNAIISSVICLILGGVFGFASNSILTTKETPSVEKKDSKEKSSVKQKKDGEQSTQIRRLKGRIKELEKLLAENKVDAPAKDVKEEKVDASRFPTNGFGFASMRKHMEDFAKRDPKRYAEITNRVARFNEHRIKQRQTQLDLLANADVESMTQEQREVHEKYQDLLVRQEELIAMMNPQTGNYSDEERDAAMREMWKNHGELRDLASKERDILLMQTANSIGFEGDDAKTVVDSIKSVYEATDLSMGNNWRRMSRGPRSSRGSRR